MQTRAFTTSLYSYHLLSFTLQRHFNLLKSFSPRRHLKRRLDRFFFLYASLKMLNELVTCCFSFWVVSVNWNISLFDLLIYCTPKTAIIPLLIVRGRDLNKLLTPSVKLLCLIHFHCVFAFHLMDSNTDFGNGIRRASLLFWCAIFKSSPLSPRPDLCCQPARSSPSPLCPPHIPYY